MKLYKVFEAILNDGDLIHPGREHTSGYSMEKSQPGTDFYAGP